MKLIAASGTESQCEGKSAEGSQQSELAFPDAPPHRHKTRNPSGDYYDKQLVLSSLVVSTETGESIAKVANLPAFGPLQLLQHKRTTIPLLCIRSHLYQLHPRQHFGLLGF